MLSKLGKHWLFLMPLAVFAGYYSLQNIVGYFRYPSEIINRMVLALVICAASYIISYKYFPIGWADRISVFSVRESTQKYIAHAITVLFIMVIVISCCGAEVPLFEAFKGASAYELAEYRNSFMRGQSGSGQLINYLYAIFLQALMPFAVAYFFCTENKFRYLAISIFIFGASLSLSKGIFLCVAAPMIAVYLMRRRWFSAAGVFGGFFLSAALMYFIASGAVGVFLERVNFSAYGPVSSEPVEGLQASKLSADQIRNLSPQQIQQLTPEQVRSLSPAQLKQFKPSQVSALSKEQKSLLSSQQIEEITPKAIALQSDVPDHYNIFTQKNQTLLILNRIIWIPYVTALDWFRYQDLHMGGKYLLGKSIRPIAYLTNSERVYLEKDVAELQWGGPSGATSNAVFFADAWLNWGALGVIVYSMLLALTIKLIITSGNSALVAASGFPVWVACFSALPPVYLSAGLGFLLILALIFRGGYSPIKNGGGNSSSTASI